MKELKPNESVNLTNGSKAKVIKELGRGGQGIVYLVELAGQKMALKWYINPPDKKFYKNLEENVAKGAPSDAFLWPEYLTVLKPKSSYGYVMKLRPQGYYEFGQYLLARVQFKSVEAMINAAMKICEGFKSLHLNGYSYQDLNDGNFFIHPETGDVLICDNDNVFPQGDKSGIMGKARYMAPEIVGGSVPDKFSDRFSLSVILFLLFYGNHPLEGARVLACPCMTESYEKKFYGSEAIFIYDEKNNTNRPVRGVHNNVLRRWMAFPAVLRETFKTEFSEECLKNPQKRKIEAEWQKVIQQLRDSLVACPVCGRETFIEDTASPKCMDCGKPFTLAGILRIGSRDILLTPNTKIYVDLDNKPDIQVINLPGDKYPVQLRNITSNKWTVETPSGKLKAIEPNMTMPVKAGLKVSISGASKGEII
ncbi:MAG: serine/threonine protein kinase [Prevotella sp.]|nr:serine/threonine protein kinase [Prevotella sp.]